LTDMSKYAEKLEYIDIDKIKPYANNPRKNDAAVDKVAESIKEFGFKVPIIIDSNNEIIAGHTRLKAAKKLGLKKVPVIKADDLTPEQVKAFRLVDNKTHEFAEWDFELLQNELFGINNIDMEKFGFEDIDIDFDAFDGDGDGGGSYISTGTKVRVVIGALMFDIDDDDHSIYEKTKAANEEMVRAQIIDLINRGELL